MVPIELVQENEVFVEIEGSCGRYLISNQGRCWNVIKQKFMPLHDNGAGYKSFALSGLSRYLNYVHRLVAKHFIPNPENKGYVNHIDHDKSNNLVSNLEWCTAKENTNAGIEAGRINAVKRGKTKSLTDYERVKCVLLRKIGYGVREIGDILNFPRTTISSVFNGRSNAELIDLVYEETSDFSENRIKLSLNNPKYLL